jgi:predicted ATP-dependent serine protease
MSNEMLSTSPGEYKRYVLKQALVMDDDALYKASNNEIAEHPPQFTTPLKGERMVSMMQGVVVVAGAPSSGKSYFAIGCGIDNALNPRNPWEVFYFNCEMSGDYVIDRALRAAATTGYSEYQCQSQTERQQAVNDIQFARIPDTFHRIDVGIGVRMEQLIEYLSDMVTDLPTMVILDSISSFVDNMDEVEGDSFGMSNLRVVQKFATAVRRLTKGQIAWVILSELNKEGRAKGRSLDHRSDMAISMSPDPDKGHLKNIKVTKSWFGPTGDLGQFVLHPEIARLVKGDF